MAGEEVVISSNLKTSVKPCDNNGMSLTSDKSDLISTSSTPGASKGNPKKVTGVPHKNG